MINPWTRAVRITRNALVAGLSFDKPEDVWLPFVCFLWENLEAIFLVIISADFLPTAFYIYTLKKAIVALMLYGSGPGLISLLSKVFSRLLLIFIALRVLGPMRVWSIVGRRCVKKSQ